MSQDVIESLVWRMVKTIGIKLKHIFSKKKTTKEKDIQVTQLEAISLNKSDVSNKENITSTKEKAEEENQSVNWLDELLEHNEIYFHFTIFLLLTLISMLNIPSVLTWAHNFK